VQLYFLYLHVHVSMSALKRALASPTSSPRLTSHVSHHNSAVTLFQLSPHEDDIEHGLRRSKRAKTQNNTNTDGQLGLDCLSHDVLSVKSWKTDADTTASGSVISSPSRPRNVQTSPKKFKAIPQSLATPHPPPSTWRETYDTIKEMRSRFVAPVDTMGCDLAQYKETDPKVINDYNPFTSTF
jgi:endonuclease-3